MIRKIKKDKLLFVDSSSKISVLSSGGTDKFENLEGEEISPFYKSQRIEYVKCIYFLLGKALEKQTKKQVAAPISLNLSDKTNELRNIKSIFKKKTKKQLDDFIIDKLEEIIQLQNFINIDNVESI